MELEISLKDLRFYSFHGVLEEEKTLGNEFKVNLSVWLPCQQEIESDELTSTLSYVSLFEIIKDEMEKPRNLLEKVCYEIVSRIKHQFSEVKRGRIEVEKVHPPISGMLGSASVAIAF